MVTSVLPQLEPRQRVEQDMDQLQVMRRRSARRFGAAASRSRLISIGFVAGAAMADVSEKYTGRAFVGNICQSI
jgi:hypothetical protein